MKIKYVILLVVLVALGFFAWSAFNSETGFAAFKLSKPYKVKFDTVTTTTPGKLVAKTGPNGKCVGNGCIEVPLGKEANITFYLIGTLNRWYFTKIQICEVPPDDEPVTKPPICSLQAWQTNEFEVTTEAIGKPNLDGVIELGFDNKLTKFVLHNYNSVPQNYFYIVTACKIIDDKDVCYDSDPPIVNKGRN